MRARIPATPLALAAALWSAPAAAGWAPDNRQVDRYNEAVELFNAGDMDGAARRLDKVLAKDPACGTCQLLLARTLLRRNQPEQALALLGPLSRAHSGQALVHEARADAAFVAEDFALAAEAGEAAVRLDPTSFAAWDGLLTTAVRVGDDRAAQLAIGRARAHLPPADVACLEGYLLVERRQLELGLEKAAACAASSYPGFGRDLEANIRSLQGDDSALKARAEELGSTSTVGLGRAGELLNAGRDAEAAAVLRASLALHPTEPRLLLMYAHALALLEDGAGALAALEAVFGATATVDMNEAGNLEGVLTKSQELELRGMVNRGLVTYVELLAERGEVARLRGALQRVSRNWEGLVAVEAGGVVLLAAGGDAAGAWTRLDAALSSFGPGPALEAAAGWLLLNDPGGATPAARAALRQGDATTLVNTSARLVSAGRPDLAGRLLSGAAPEGPALAIWATNLHVCAEETGTVAWMDEAVAALGGLGALEPGFRLSHAAALARLELPDRALAALDGLQPEDPAARRRAADLRVDLLLGRDDLEAARKVVAAEPAGPVARANVAVTLLNGGDAGAALPLLEGACPEMAGDGAAWCADVLKSARKRTEQGRGVGGAE